MLKLLDYHNEIVNHLSSYPKYVPAMYCINGTIVPRYSWPRYKTQYYPQADMNVSLRVQDSRLV